MRVSFSMRIFLAGALCLWGAAVFPVPCAAAADPRPEPEVREETDRETVSPELGRYAEGLVQRLFVGTGVFETVEAAANIVVDGRVTEQAEHRYEAAKGQEQGRLSGEGSYAEESGDGQILGEWKDYLPDERISRILEPQVRMIPEKSAIAVTATVRKVYREKELRESGELDGVSFRQFQRQHGQKRLKETEETYAGLVSQALGIPRENVTVMVYETPEFIEDAESQSPAVTGLLIPAAGGILIFAAVLLLLKTVFRKKKAKRKKEVPRSRKGEAEKDGPGKRGAGKGRDEAVRAGESREKTGGGAPARPDRQAGSEKNRMKAQAGEKMSEAERYIRAYIDQNPGEATGKFKSWKDTDRK